MSGSIARTIRRWFDPEQGVADHQISRWIFLRALGVIYFSAFYSLVFQIRGLIGPRGILPAEEYLAWVTKDLETKVFPRALSLALQRGQGGRL